MDLDKLHSNSDIKFTVINENIKRRNHQEPRSKSENVLIRPNMGYSGELNFVGLADFDKIRLKQLNKNKLKKDYSLPVIGTFNKDETNLKNKNHSGSSDTDHLPEDLEAIRHRVVGADGNLTNSWSMPWKYECQPPLPYINPMSDFGHNDDDHRGPGLGLEVNPLLARKIRHNFIKKVYLILLVQLLITFTFVLICTYEKHVRKYVRQDWIGLICASIVTFILLITIGCYEKVRKFWPVNFILLFALVLSMTYVVSHSATIAPPYLVLIAIGVTLIVCTLISIFAWQTKWDITGLGFMFVMLGLVLMIFGFIAMLFYIFTGSKILHLIYCGLGVLFISAVLIYDTQIIVGGRKYQLSEEEYIAAALTLYFDVILFFYFFIQLISGGGGN